MLFLILELTANKWNPKEKYDSYMRLLKIGETIKKTDEVNIQLFGEWKPIWEKVKCFVGWKVTEGTYGKYRRRYE